MLRRRICFCLLMGLAVHTTVQANEVDAIVPLHQQIDASINAAHFGETARIATDAEFLRRISLDLIGRSPTAQETKSFLANGDPNKRTVLVDTLINSDEFTDFFTAVLDIMLMERRADKRIPQAEWRAFLRRALAEKQPYDVIVNSILTADGTGDTRGAAKFLLEREVEPNAVTRDVGRVFLGRDLQCAQCHDHPLVDDYLQSEYYGIFAFVNRSYLFEDQADKKKAYVAEKAEGTTEFKSVFSTDADASQTIPRLLDGLTLDVEPRLEGEEPYVVAPTNKTAGVPKFSRRAQLARLVTHPANIHFARNTVNRLWAHMLGRGIVHPVDFHHSDNPPSHPELLQTLADEFVAMRFDLREFLRQIALSDTYQRSVEFPDEPTVTVADVETEIATIQDSVTELEADATKDVERAEFQDRLKTARDRVTQIDQTISDAVKRLDEFGKQSQELTKKGQELKKQLGTKQSQLTALKAAVTAAQKAVEAFSKDEALAKAHTDYQLRVERVAKEVEGTQKSITDNQQQSVQVTEQLNGEKRQLAKLKAQRIGLVDMVAEARGALHVFRERRNRHESVLNEQRQRLTALTTHREYLVQLNRQRDLAARHAQLAATPGVPAETLNDLEKSVAEAEKVVAAKRSAVASLSQTATATAEVLEKKSAALARLQAAVTEAKNAAEQLANPQLAASVETMKTQLAFLDDELANARNELERQNVGLEMAQKELRELVGNQQQLVAQHESVRKRAAEYERELAKATEAAATAAVETDRARARVRESWERRFVVRSLNPLTPEQLAGSTMAALSLKLRFQQEAETEWLNNNKDTKPDDIDRSKQKDEIAALVQKRIAQVHSTFISLFAAPAGAPQDVFSSTADQALFFANDGRIQGWLSPSAGTLTHRLQSVQNANELAEELHLAILSRSATDTEKQQVTEYLAQRADDRNKAIRELVWGLLSSLEFRFNH